MGPNFFTFDESKPKDPGRRGSNRSVRVGLVELGGRIDLERCDPINRLCDMSVGCRLKRVPKRSSWLVAYNRDLSAGISDSVRSRGMFA